MEDKRATLTLIPINNLLKTDNNNNKITDENQLSETAESKDRSRTFGTIDHLSRCEYHC